MIRDNIAIVGKSMRADRLAAKVYPSDATTWTTSSDNRFDLIFCDPPYDVIEKLAEKLFKQFDRLLAKDGTVIFEMPGEIELDSPGWHLRKRLGKGKNQPTICFYEKSSSQL